MVDQNTTSDINTSTENNDVQGNSEEKPVYMTSKEFNSAFTARSKSLEKQITELKDLVVRQSTSKEPEPEKKEGIQWKSRVEALEQTLAQERQQKSDLEMRNQVKDILTGLNARPSLVKALMAQLIEADKSITMIDGIPAMKNSFGDYVDLETGLKELSKQSDYEEFFTGKVSVGSGAKSIKQTTKTTSNQTDDEAKSNLMGLLGLVK